MKIKKIRTSYLFILLIILSICSLFIGVKEIKITDLIALDETSIKFMLVSRIPRLLSVLIAGVVVSISGLIMQQITRNKFVSPTTAATEDFAKLGFLLVLIALPGASYMYKLIFSFGFALIGTAIFMKLIRNMKFKNDIFIPLVGIMFGNVISSMTTFIAYRYDMIQSIGSFTQGNFATILKGKYELLFITVPLVIIAYTYANKFTVAGMGEDFSSNLGLNYNSVVNIGLVIVSLCTSLVIITVGNIPYLGLIVPNIVTMFNGDNMKKNIIPVSIFGALFILICDMFGRLIIFPYEISIGLTVGVIGSVIFLYLLIRRYRNE
jgi:iron complex transport system permease protein